MSDPLFWIQDLRVAYPSSRGRSGAQMVESWAVDGVSLILEPGETLGLVGESGCGKSTLGRAAMRLLPSTTKIEGRVTFEGRSVYELSSLALRQFRGEAVALIFQDPMTRLNPVMPIGEHCLETLLAHRPGLSRRQAKVQAIGTLEAVNIPASRWAQYPHEFSGGMRQRVSIALALLLNPKLIVADEPTTSLDVTVSAQILQELTRLCQERSMALLVISHDLAMIGEYCDRIAVMYSGKIVETGATTSVLQSPQHAYTRSLLKAALHIQAVQPGMGDGEWQAETRAQETEPIAPIWNKGLKPLVSADAQTQETEPIAPLLRIQDLKQYYTLEQGLISRLFSPTDQTIRAVDGVSLDLYPGETLGLVGESGCGKSTLSRTLLQLIRPTSGRVEFLGRDIVHLSAANLRHQRRQMQMVFQDPHACLNPVMTVGQSIADPLAIHQLAPVAQAKQQVLQMLERVGLTPAEIYYARYPADLSGGQQQRVAIARALITRPQLLVCDEPVSMLDASVQTQVLELMRELKHEFNLTYLFITHDLWVARFFCDRIAVMQAGKIVELNSTHEIFTNPQHPYTQTLLHAAPLLATVTTKLP